jgi:spore coat protein CotF
MELHEVLSETITGINTVQLYGDHVRDPQLKSMIDRQLEFMTNEYNNMVRALQQEGYHEAVPYRANMNFSPTYGLRSPSSTTPNASATQIDDRDAASAVMSIHKTGASKRMMASLECANPQLRKMLIQGAVNCADQAYDVWQFMNSRGYYQVPTMQQNTTNTMMNIYQPTM